MSLTKGASRPWYLSAKGQWLWGGLSLLGLCLLWALSTSSPAGLQMEVPGFPSWSLLETKRAYLYLHIFTFLPVFLLSFDKKVHFYKKWKFLFPAIGMVGLFFILWDEYFTKVGVWGFNPDYLMGWYVLDLPVEEMLFFFTVPYACVFTYECLKVYLPKDPLVRWEQPISYGLLILFWWSVFSGYNICIRPPPFCCVPLYRPFTCFTFPLPGAVDSTWDMRSH